MLLSSKQLSFLVIMIIGGYFTTHAWYKGVEKGLWQLSRKIRQQQQQQQQQQQTCLFSTTYSVPVQRIERILANRGIGTRTEVTTILKQGRVKVKGKVIRSGGDRFPSNIEIVVDNQPVEEIPDMVVYHKPIGVHSTYGDPWKRPNLNELKDRFSYFKSLHPIGRLDADSSGLLLFGRDGTITQHLLNPKKKVEREYDTLVLGNVDYLSLKETLAKGINTSEGIFPGILSYAKTFSGTKDLEYFRHLIQEKNETLSNPNNRKDQDKIDQVELNSIISAKAISYLRIAVTEGKYRMVRRILHNAGHSVCFLRRRRYGNILIHPNDEQINYDAINELEKFWPIPSNLAEDAIRKLTAEEWKWIQSLTK